MANGYSPQRPGGGCAAAIASLCISSILEWRTVKCRCVHVGTIELQPRQDVSVRYRPTKSNKPLMAVEGVKMASVDDITDEQLLERAVKAARPRRGRVPRWSAVADLFALGSTYSIQLCRRFGLDPDQQIGRNSVVR